MARENQIVAQVLAGKTSEFRNRVEQYQQPVFRFARNVIGDNRDRSRDSRHIGSIHVGDVIGYVDYNFFPAETWSRFGLYRD